MSNSGWLLGASQRECLHLELGHQADGELVHLISARWWPLALCGTTIDYRGEPDLAIICDLCETDGLTLLPTNRDGDRAPPQHDLR